MSDTSTTSTTPTEQTNPLDSGHTTTEWKVTIVASVLSILVTVVGVASNFLDVVQQAGVTGKWVSIATTIVGVLGTVLTALGYQVTRSAVKKAAVTASTGTPTVTPAVAAANIGTVRS
ncbi:MAG TPA: hypothetical protein VGI97_00580 [Gemmatimonadaceae bacterium]|jgi:hypothetical protein